MSDVLDTLKRLQAIDTALYELRQQEHEKPAELERARAEATAQAARLKAAENRLKTLQLAHKEKEVELQTREASVKKLQGQLFQVKTNKEYTAMQHEIETLKADNSVLEETLLKNFDTIDQATKERQRQQHVAVQHQQRLQQEEQRIQQELVGLRERMARLEQDRHVLTPVVPHEKLTAYERILKMREGLALVPIVNESCGGCHRRLRPQVVNEACLGAALATCDSCNRILYVDDAQSAV